jgi:epoxide hydrolase-like predicted phosphatase
VRAVFFDYAGVLGTPPFDGVEDWEREMGYPRGATFRVIMRGGYLEVDSGHGFHHVEKGQRTLREFLEQAAEGSEELLEGRRFDAAAYLRFLDEPRFGAQWPFVHVARDLRARGARVGIITNNIPEWESTWTRTIPLDWFDDVVDSCVVGLRKPEPEIYLLACRRVGVRPEDSVFLDDFEQNVEGARAVGMDAIHVREPRSALAELDALLRTRGTGG